MQTEAIKNRLPPVGINWQAVLPGLTFVIFAIAVLAISTRTSGLDWETAYRPAVLAILAGKSPYSAPGFFTPWALLPLIPFALLPVHIGSILLAAASPITFAYVAHKMGARPFVIALAMLTPSMFYSWASVSMDWMVTLGFLMPPSIGIFFVLIKPQLGMAIAALWAVQAYQSGGWKAAIRLLAPVAILFLISIVMYGPWFLQSRPLTNAPWNASLWPYSIPIGLILAYLSIHKRNIKPAILASPLLSPYVGIYSWQIGLIGLIPSPIKMLAGVIFLWALDLYRIFQ